MANIERAKAEKAKAKKAAENRSKSKNKKERSKSSNHSRFESSDDNHLLQNQVKQYQPSTSPQMLSTQIKQIIMGGKQFLTSPSYNYIKNLSSHKKKKRVGQKTIYVDDLEVKGKVHLISGNHDSCNINDSCAEHASENYISFANQISGEYQVQFQHKRADERLPQSNVP
jgi:calcineurin-like phosphoesterase family protein